MTPTQSSNSDSSKTQTAGTVTTVTPKEKTDKQGKITGYTVTGTDKNGKEVTKNYDVGHKYKTADKAKAAAEKYAKTLNPPKGTATEETKETTASAKEKKDKYDAAVKAKKEADEKVEKLKTQIKTAEDKGEDTTKLKEQLKTAEEEQKTAADKVESTKKDAEDAQYEIDSAAADARMQARLAEERKESEAAMAIEEENEQKYGIDEAAETATSVYNFQLPNWSYTDYVNELDNFRKGISAFGNDPGWFYFKIFFHFSDNFGLLSNIITNTNNITNNSAANFLKRRVNIYKYDNLKSRLIALQTFVRYLSSININTPWFFDKISGLDKAGVLTNDFTKEKTVDIGCIEDAIDMRLTTLFHLYQYACYDEINQKEIIPENLRKFNMSVMIYHVPLRFFSSGLNGSTASVTETSDTTSRFSNRMSYKLYTFKGCEFDLDSVKTATIPSSMESNTPFQLGKGSFKIKYDKSFTHLMNEWEQLMVGPDGIYYYPRYGINVDGNNVMNTRLETMKSKTNSSDWFIDGGTGSEFFVQYGAEGEALGNIYNLDIKALQQGTIEENTSHIYLANLFDYNPVLFRAYVLQNNVSPGKTVRQTMRGTDLNGYEVTMVSSSGFTGAGTGVSNFGNIGNVASILDNTKQQYIQAWRNSSVLHNGLGTEDYYSVYQLLESSRYQEKYMYGTLYYTQDYQVSLNNLVTTWTKSWNQVKGIWKSITSNVDNTMDTIKNVLSIK